MPESIAETLTSDHRRCDRLLALVEAASGAGDWELTACEAQGFQRAMERHFRFEEERLFPSLEAVAPMAGAPIEVMRLEHGQMRQLLTELLAAVQTQSRDDCLGLLDTLHLVIQQHNAKEEAILYPLADRALAEEAPGLLSGLAE